MALIVEDGSGKSTADSYLSVADADTYHTAHSGSSDWSGAETADKETALRMATQYIDMTYHRRWKTARTNDTQALDWPRILVEDRDGYFVDSDEIPQKLKDACAEAALLHITESAGLMPNLTNPGSIKKTTVKVGPITKGVEYAGAASQVKQFRIVDYLLTDYIEQGSSVQRG